MVSFSSVFLRQFPCPVAILFDKSCLSWRWSSKTLPCSVLKKAKEIKWIFHYFVKIGSLKFSLFFENTNNFSLKYLLHDMLWKIVWRFKSNCNTFHCCLHSDVLYTLLLETFAGFQFFSKIVKFNSREIYWRQSNVKIKSAKIQVLELRLYVISA